jgi:hypothetical protein
VLQLTEKEAKRASIVVQLLYEFIDLLFATNERARQLDAM